MFHHFDEQVILEGRPELSVVVVLRHQRPPFDDNAWLNRAETARVISSEWSTLPLPMRGRGSFGAGAAFGCDRRDITLMSRVGMLGEDSPKAGSFNSELDKWLSVSSSKDSAMCK